MIPKQTVGTPLREKAGLMPSLVLHEIEPHIRPSTKTEAEQIFTARDYINYAYHLTTIRITEWYDQATPEIKNMWKNDTDALLRLSDRGPLLPDPSTEEAKVIHNLTEALKLQRRREEELAHVTPKVMLDIWTSARKQAETYLKT